MYTFHSLTLINVCIVLSVLACRSYAPVSQGRSTTLGIRHFPQDLGNQSASNLNEKSTTLSIDDAFASL